MAQFSNENQPADATALLLLEDGSVFWGKGFGAQTKAAAEICFNTSMTGYQETLSDPSYAGQIITFTFPHIGNVGTNEEDFECRVPKARGLIVRENPTSPSNWRSKDHFESWLVAQGLPGIYGIDTRTLTQHIRNNGAPNGIICHNAEGQFDLEALAAELKNFPGLEGLDLAKEVTCEAPYEWTGGTWTLEDGYTSPTPEKPHVVAIDFGAKENIMRCLLSAGCKVTVVPAQTSTEDILAYNPDGVFLSNGPGDPEATGQYAVPAIQALLDKNIPIFGICMGHQLLARALGAKTRKMHLGHRGANHPVKDIATGTVEITSQNHGFEVLEQSLPANVEASHISLFDGSNEGLRVKDKPAFSVQYHPEASPGPQDSHYLFDRFIEMIKAA